MSVQRLLVLAAVAVVGLAGCGGDATAEGIEPVDGHTVTAQDVTLNGPTQMIVGPDDRLWVAELDGGENEGTGRVLALDLATDDDGVTVSGEPEVLVDGLLKPTGIAVLDDHLWVMEQRSLVRFPLDGAEVAGDKEVLFEELPYNGRSEGTLEVLDGQVVWITSGTGGGSDPGPDSGKVWLTDPSTPTERTEFASGFKNAYSLFPREDGSLLIGEVAEPIDGGDAPADELNIVTEGADGGWPLCSANREPTESLGGTEEVCADTLEPFALFPPRATPTSVVEFGDLSLAALWVEGEVVAVEGVRLEGESAGVETWFAGEALQRPQHLLVVGDSLLVSDHEDGQLWAVTPS